MTRAAAAALNDHADDPRDLDAPADDRVDGPLDRAEKRDVADAEEAEPREPVKREGPYEARRKAIAEKFRRQRAGDQDAIDVYGGEDREKEIFGDKIETRSDRLRAADDVDGGGTETGHGAAGDDAAPAGETAAERRRRKLKVNGRELELDEDEIVAHAQRSLAAGQVLEDAKRIRDSYYQKLEALAAAREHQPAEARTTERQTTDASEDTKPDDQELDDIIDKIQVGDRREAGEALRKHDAALEQRILAKIGNLDERIERYTNAQAERQTVEQQTRSTLEQFVSDHSEFAENPVLQQALQGQLIGTMRERMAEIGVNDEGLRRFQQSMGINDPAAAVGAAYRWLRNNNYSLPEQGEVLKESAERVRSAFRSAYGDKEQTDRGVDTLRRTEALQRKRSMALQPRRAGASVVEQPDLSRDEVRRQAARDARAARRGR